MASQHMTVGELSSFLLYTFWVGISIAGNIQRQALNEQCNFSLYEYSVFVPVGLSSFYSELMKGFGAGARLWELLDRKPEFSQNGKHTQNQNRHKAKKAWVIYFTLICFYFFVRLKLCHCSANFCSFYFCIMQNKQHVWLISSSSSEFQQRVWCFIQNN